MTGTIRWNVYGAAAAFVLTFLISVSHNIFATTMLRSLYSFLIVFALLFLFRFVLSLIVNGSSLEGEDVGEQSDDAALAAGRNVDLATPDDDSLNDMLRANLTAVPDDDGTGFAPLKPPKLVSQSAELDPEELANALRRMSEE
jgi:hypothetical protein